MKIFSEGSKSGFSDKMIKTRDARSRRIIDPPLLTLGVFGSEAVTLSLKAMTAFIAASPLHVKILMSLRDVLNIRELNHFKFCFSLWEQLRNRSRSTRMARIMNKSK